MFTNDEKTAFRSPFLMTLKKLVTLMKFAEEETNQYNKTLSVWHFGIKISQIKNA